MNNEYNTQELGKRLRTLRQSKNMTLKQIQEIAFIDLGTISKIEKGSIASVTTLEKLCQALGTTLEFELSQSQDLGLCPINVGMVCSAQTLKFKYVFADVELIEKESINDLNSIFVFILKDEILNYYPIYYLPVISLDNCCLICKTQKLISLRNDKRSIQFFANIVVQVKRHNLDQKDTLEVFFYPEYLLM